MAVKVKPYYMLHKYMKHRLESRLVASHMTNPNQ